jgi:uncharacterized protein (DUF2235 family)
MKRLVCSLDGMRNDDGRALPLTNVAKLHSAISPRDRKGVRQLVRYISGVAGREGLRFAFFRDAIGYEIEARIKLAYQFLRDAYDPGDEIYLFGFSRGAYEVRSLASFVTLFGIARKDSDFSFDDAWRLYRQSDHKRDVDALARLSAACHYPVRIRCVGVWDTVANIGNRRSAFHDMRLHDTIDVALQALSIDEKRNAFRPILFTLPEETTLASHQHVEQTWFAGTHADIGGGWPEAGLSDITLIWMAKRVMARTGLAIDLARLRRAARPKSLGLQHESATGFSGLVPFIRLINQDTDAIPTARRRFFGTWRTGKLGPGRISLNETIHESALTRLGASVAQARKQTVQDIIYQPRSLLAATAAAPLSDATEENVIARVA